MKLSAITLAWLTVSPFILMAVVFTVYERGMPPVAGWFYPLLLIGVAVVFLGMGLLTKDK